MKMDILKLVSSVIHFSRRLELVFKEMFRAGTPSSVIELVEGAD